MINNNAVPLESDPKNLIVNYIPTPVMDEELRNLFSPFGTVESARVILDRATHHPKGYGFVKFASEEAAKKAMGRMNGYEIGNKRLRVTQANGPQNRSLQQYSDRLVHMQSTSPAQQLQALPAGTFLPQTYTVVGTGAPIYQTTAGLPTLMLAQQSGQPSQLPSYQCFQQQQQQGQPSHQQQQQMDLSGAAGIQALPPNTVIIEVDGKPMQLIANGPLPNIFQQYSNANASNTISTNTSQTHMASQLPPQQQPPPPPPPPQQLVRPLCFAPFRPGSPQGDPMMHSSFQLSVGGSSSALASVASYDPANTQHNLAAMQHSGTNYLASGIISLNGSMNTL